MSFTISELLQQLANGLTLGSLYALVAIGYTMVYGILRLINFAHGDIFMMSMYFAFYAISVFYLPWYIAVVLVILATGLLGVIIERCAYKPLRDAPRISLMISSIGVSYLLENLAIVLFTGIQKNFPSIPLFQDIITIGSIRMQRLTILVPIITAVIAVVLLYLINHTKTGLAMRAASKDLEAAKLMGLNINRTIAMTFFIGSILAATGAIMWGLKYPQIQAYVGTMPGLKCFIAAVIGGIGNIKGAIVGALLRGMMEILIFFLLPGLTRYKDAFAFIALVVILLWKPTGILGEKIAEKV